MPTWLKVVLLIFVIGMTVLIGGIYLTYRWVRTHRDEVRAGAQKIVAEGEQFGRGRSGDACVAEALERGDRCGFANVVCEAKTKVFLDRCLAVATVPDEFCANVPKVENIVGSVPWAIRECARRGHPNEQRCTRLLQSVQAYCEKR